MHFNINIGIYGMPQNQTPLDRRLSALESKLCDLGGRKWLYTNSSYTPEQFWSIYQESDYRSLREKYHADRAWVCIASKVLSSKKRT